MKSEYIIRSYDSGGKEIICTTNGYRIVIYNSGDTLHYYCEELVSIATHDGHYIEVDIEAAEKTQPSFDDFCSMVEDLTHII